MTPDKIAKPGTESAHQCAFFAWCAVAQNHGFAAADMWADTGKIMPGNGPAVWPLEWIYHTPNGGTRGNDARERAIRGGKLKAEGVKAGIPDIFLPYPIAAYHGLYIEMKKPTQKPKRGGSGGVSQEQAAFVEFARANAYAVAVCYSWREAADTVKAYFYGGFDNANK